ncbi:MAG: hypothetical protein M1833_002292 [Piccolia ochrophora]|nr:MAG: hypothetical protein M1833_002292 [Piccolia ochrophora]
MVNLILLFLAPLVLGSALYERAAKCSQDSCLKVLQQNSVGATSFCSFHIKIPVSTKTLRYTSYVVAPPPTSTTKGPKAKRLPGPVPDPVPPQITARQVAQRAPQDVAEGKPGPSAASTRALCVRTAGCRIGARARIMRAWVRVFFKRDRWRRSRGYLRQGLVDSGWGFCCSSTFK